MAGPSHHDLQRRITVNVRMDDALAIMKRVTYPGRCSAGVNYSNVDFFNYLFESWTSYDPLRIRKLRIRKTSMPFVDVELVEREGVVDIIVSTKAKRRRVVGALTALVAASLFVLLTTAFHAPFLVLLGLAYLFIKSLVVLDSPRCEVGAVARMLEKVMTPKIARDPALLERFIGNRMLIN